MSNCSGQCCESFSIRDSYLDVITSPTRTGVDEAKILDMLIELEWHDDYVNCTCKHFNTETRKCMNYADRPEMCSGYGVNYPCEHEDCTI